MAKKIILGLVLVSAIAACQPKEPDVYVPTTTEPITTEPVYQGKYGS